MVTLQAWEVILHRQGGVIQFQQLLDAGVTRHQLRCLVRDGRLVRLGPGIYGQPVPSDPWRRDLNLALLRGGPDAVVWRRSAGRWWGLDALDRDDAVEVAVGLAGPSRDPGVFRLRRRSSLLTTVERGVVVTDVAQTLLDLGTACDANVVERAMEDGLRRRLVRVDQLQALVEAAPRARSGAVVLSEVLHRRPVGAPPTESDAETLFLQIVRSGGFPEPQRQLPLVLDGRPVRLDFGWPTPRYAVEIDGAKFHGEEARGYDLRRQNSVMLGGWWIARFTWQDVALYPEYPLRVLRDWFS